MVLQKIIMTSSDNLISNNMHASQSRHANSILMESQRPLLPTQGNQTYITRPGGVDREFINRYDEEEFASARGSLKGNSNFESVIEYDNLSYAMDSRVNPLLLKSSKTGLIQDSNGEYYSKAQSPNHHLTHQGSNRFSQHASQANYQQPKERPRLPSNKLIQINPSSINRINSGMNQSVSGGSQISIHNSRMGSPNHQMVSAQRVQSPQNLTLHPFVEVELNNTRN